TPSHRTIHENGVVPNIVATLTPSQEQNLSEWFSRDTFSPEERKKVESFVDPQLVRAVDAMKGALVYSAIKPGGAADAGEGKPDDTRGKSDSGKIDENTSKMSSPESPKPTSEAPKPEPEP